MLGDAVFDPRKARHGKGNRWARIPVTLSWGRAIARQADGAGRSLNSRPSARRSKPQLPAFGLPPSPSLRQARDRLDGEEKNIVFTKNRVYKNIAFTKTSCLQRYRVYKDNSEGSHPPFSIRCWKTPRRRVPGAPLALVCLRAAFFQRPLPLLRPVC